MTLRRFSSPKKIFGFMRGLGGISPNSAVRSRIISRAVFAANSLKS
jgi:hypothetical protein